MTAVKLYDTTLRDGMQGQGMSLSAAEKVRVVHALDQLGVQFIEAGFPASNPKEAELFELLAGEELRQAAICAFGMTRRRGVEADQDEALKLLASTFAPVVTLVGKTWSLHLEKVTKVSREENLAMIGESIAYLRGEDKRVMYDAEHFFDAWDDDPDYAVECLKAADQAGAEVLVLCDTNGAHLPAQIGTVVSQVSEALPEAELGIHCHNDLECGVANALAAVDAGARQVQGTVNGYGERCGNSNLISILPSLQLKMGYEVVPPENLKELSSVSHFVADLLNVAVDPDQAYVGRNAFAHKGGMHVAGIAADARTFEHMDPGAVGNSRSVLPSELSGKATVVARAEEIGLELDDEAAREAVETLKQKEHDGYHYEAAEASFDLLLRREAGQYRPLFTFESFKVQTELRAGEAVETEAIVKIRVGEERYVEVAEGNGPVNALDRALRQAITRHYPELDDIELTGYRVRILDTAHGTGAGTRVLLDSRRGDGGDSWGSIGVSENIIEASWEALVDSLAYAFQNGNSGAASG
ncbi:MAG: citramalate synthase [Solirubrobacterales bacterium]|nr:citramalate synthase [Solirubrobacterales bacterium]OJU94039.1 MAG: citramalate synthase [Solirubrobacterales bacterium 67-14]